MKSIHVWPEFTCILFAYLCWRGPVVVTPIGEYAALCDRVVSLELFVAGCAALVREILVQGKTQ